MKLTDIGESYILPELVPPATPGTAPAPQPQTSTTSSNAAPNPQAQAQMMAQQALDRANKKKEIQDQIRAKQQELADLQKQLAEIK